MSDTKWSNPHYTNYYSHRAYVGDYILQVSLRKDARWNWSITNRDAYGDCAELEEGIEPSMEEARRAVTRVMRSLVEEMMQELEQLGA